MIGKILGKLNWFKRVVLAKAGVKRRYRIGNSYITLDFTHRLPDYQFSHPYYDRFLPHLVSYLPSHSVVIDVGANVGDTLVGMIGANSEIEYLLFGHLGDCHLHFHLIPTLEQNSISKIVYKNIVSLSSSLGGVYSAEHGTGKRKRMDFLECYGQDAVDEVVESKKSIDPYGLINIGNVISSTLN